MTKALLTAAGISWLYLRDENGRYTGQRELAVIVEFQSKRINGKRCAFQQRYSEQMLKHIAMHIEDFAKKAYEDSGTHFVFASDEMYMAAERPLGMMLNNI